MRTRTAITATLASIGVLGLSFGIGVEGEALLHQGVAPTTPVAPPTAPSPTTPTTTSPAATASSPAATSSASPKHQPVSTKSATPKATPTKVAVPSKYKAGSYTGTSFSNQYGDVTVTVTVSSSKVLKAAAVTTAPDGRSQQINGQAVPILNAEVTQKQSASISQVSGATFTSGSYIQSLQAALDKAKS